MEKTFANRKKWEEYLWKELVASWKNANSTEILDGLICQVMSNYEKTMILRRATVLIMLRSGCSYKEISRALWISPSTIRNIKKNMLVKGGYKTRRETQKKKEATPPHSPTFIDELEERLIMFLEGILKGKTDMRYRWNFLKH